MNEFYSPTKNKIMSSSRKQMKEETIMLNKTNQTQMKDNVSLLYHWSKVTDRNKKGKVHLGSGCQKITAYHDMAE